MKNFPNGFTSWQETHFEVVSKITGIMRADKLTGIVATKYYGQGTGGVYELAEELTDEFEELNKAREWDGDFFDEIELFLTEKLK